MKFSLLNKIYIIIKTKPHFISSLGNVDSLIQHSPSMSHFDMSPEERHAAEIFDGQVRLSVGIEDVDDLIADLDQALALI